MRLWSIHPQYLDTKGLYCKFSVISIRVNPSIQGDIIIINYYVIKNI